MGKITEQFTEVFFYATITPSVAVAGITGVIAVPATFTSTVTNGVGYRWAWTAVPAGSVLANSAPVPYPNNGAVTPIDMTNNAVLYHCENNGTDSSGNGNTATFTNVTTNADPQVGTYSWAFTAADSEASLTTAVSFAGGNWTAAFWFYNLIAGTARTALVSADTFDSVYIDATDYLGVWSGGQTRCSNNVKMTGAAYTGWHLFVVVGTGSNTVMYVDGVAIGTVNNVKSTNNAKKIGGQSVFSQRWAERIDEVAIWQRALSSLEIWNIYSLQKGLYAGTSGTSSTFVFTPDVSGTYTVQLTVFSTDNLSVASTTASAVISTPSRAPATEDDLFFIAVCNIPMCQ